MKRLYKTSTKTILTSDQTHARQYEKSAQTLRDRSLWDKMCPDDKIPHAPKDDDTRYQNNLYRMRMNMVDILENNLNHHSHFVTLTYKENMQDYDKASKDFKAFVRSLRLSWGDFKYLGTKELQDRGAIHFHLVVFGEKKLSTKQVQKAWSHGFVKTKPIKDISEPLRVARYMTKYISKSEYERQVKTKKKMLLASRDVVRTQRIEGTSEAWLYIQENDIKPTKVKMTRHAGLVMTYELPTDIISQEAPTQ